jgi:hypothetical protein
MRSLGLRVQRPVLPCSALQDPFLMGQLGLAWTKGLQEGEDKRFIQVHQWEMMGNCYLYLWVSMHIYGTSLGNDVEKAMEMAKLLLISIWINISFRTAIVMFVMDFLKVICYFSLFCHWFIQEKKGNLLGIYCFIPPNDG